MSPNCARKISGVSYTASGSRFSLGEDEFEIPLVGEFNVRNAAMAISAARFYGVSLEAMDSDLMLAALPGVFCAGEMLDWEAPTGGYLLTACHASGHRAGRAAASWLASGNNPPR